MVFPNRANGEWTPAYSQPSLPVSPGTVAGRGTFGVRLFRAALGRGFPDPRRTTIPEDTHRNPAHKFGAPGVYPGET